MKAYPLWLNKGARKRGPYSEQQSVTLPLWAKLGARKQVVGVAPARALVWGAATLHFIVGCAPAPFTPSPKPDDLDPVAEAVRDLTGRRTRTVWLQDIGDGADYLAHGKNLQLMGMDSEDFMLELYYDLKL